MPARRRSGIVELFLDLPTERLDLVGQILHFAEIYYREPGHRRFDVLLEGKKVLEGYEPKVARAEKFVFEEEVVDGYLELDFARGVKWINDPTISAIEVELLR